MCAMKYLLFDNPAKDYGVKFEQGIVGVRNRGFGAYDTKVASGVLEEHEGSVREINEAQFDRIKKKYELGPPSSRRMNTAHQDPTKIPDAVYAENPPEEPSEVPIEELIEVGEAIVDDPLKDT